MADLAQMDYEAIERVAKGFRDSGEMLQNIDRFIEALLTTLRVECFVGLVSTAMLDNYVNSVRTKLNEVVKTFMEMSDDLVKTVAQTRQTDERIGGTFTN